MKLILIYFVKSNMPKYNHLTCNKKLYILLFSHKYVEKMGIYFKFDIILYCVLLLNKWSEAAQLCLTLCNPVDCSLSGFSNHGIFQARVPGWTAISFSRLLRKLLLFIEHILWARHCAKYLFQMSWYLSPFY